MEEVSIREGFFSMDFAAVTRLLAAAPWSRDIARAEVEKAARNSTLVVGAFCGARQIGFARCLSDKVRFCYLMDVIVDPQNRASGVGRRMVSHILNHPDLQDVYQWMLLTTRAHDFYRSLGFCETARARDLMEIRRERPVR